MTDATAEPSLDDVVSLFRDYSGDEAGGQHAIRGFSFQIWQAVLEALRAHATGEDYAVVLEWQQDIAVLDSSTKPTQVRFIQLKKNEASHHWTLHGLLSTPAEEVLSPAVPVVTTDAAAASAPKKKSRSKTPPLSVLGKLYFHRRRFSAHTPTELVFASNAPFYVHVGDGGAEETAAEVILSELPAAPLDKVRTALRRQLKVPEVEDLPLENFSLKVTNCPVEDSHKFAIGELSELCALHKIEPQVKAPFIAVFLIASYVKQRAGKGGFAKDFDALLTRAVTRTDITRYFAAANDAHVSTQDLVDKVIERLNLEVADYEVVEEMQNEIHAACAEITNRASVVWTSVAALIRLFKEKGSYKNKGGALKNRLSAWLTDFRDLKPEGSELFKDGYILCLMAMIIKNARPIQHLSTASTDSQPEAAK